MLGQNKQMPLIFLTFRRNVNFEEIFRVRVHYKMHICFPEKNFITPIHRGISAISSKFLPYQIYANMYTRAIFQIIFFKKSVILPIKCRQKMPKAWKDAPCSKHFFQDFYFDDHTNGTLDI